MRFLRDDELSFCLTVSKEIERDTMLSLLGVVFPLPQPQSFDDFAEETHRVGQRGLINVFEEDDFLITLENSGFMGINSSTTIHTTTVTGEDGGHYAAILYAPLVGAGYRYVEIQDGLVLADFNPLLDEAPESVDKFFPQPSAAAEDLIAALEYRMEVKVRDEWLNQPTETYIIDYRTIRV